MKNWVISIGFCIMLNALIFIIFNKLAIIKGVHDNSGKGIDLELKKECQRRFEDIHGHEKFMEVFKKNYI